MTGDREIAMPMSVAEVLSEAAETHGTVYKIIDGQDADWASWYANWLIKLSPLPDLLGVTPVRSELVYLLVRLDKEYTSTPREQRWEDFYASGLVAHFGPDAHG
jgi:hypothetical protein